MRKFITKTNEWYDKLPTNKREIFFVVFVMGTLLIAELALWVYACLWALPTWIAVMGGWRLSYLRFKSKKNQVYVLKTKR